MYEKVPWLSASPSNRGSGQNSEASLGPRGGAASVSKSPAFFAERPRKMEDSPANSMTFLPQLLTYRNEPIMVAHFSASYLSGPRSGADPLTPLYPSRCENRSDQNSFELHK